MTGESHIEAMKAGIIGSGPHAGKSATVRKIGGGAQVIPTAVRTPLEYDEIIHDDLGFFDIGAPTQLVIPDVDPPIRAVRCWGNINWAVGAAPSVEYVLFADDGGGGGLALPPAGFFANFVAGAGNQPIAWNGASGPIADIGGNGQFVLKAGDIFEFTVRQDSGVGVTADRSVFSIEVLR